MIDEQNSGRPVRTRPFTWPEVLRAVAHVLARPGGPRHTPQVSHYSGSIDAHITVSDHVEKRPLGCADVVQWARVMDRVDAVRIGAYGGHVQAHVDGVITGGVAVDVLLFLDRERFPIEMLDGDPDAAITVDELVALAEHERPVAEPADQAADDARVLAGAR